jgi:hypothetical protein
MNGSVSLTGTDTIQIDSRNLNDLADADAVVLTFPNDLAAVKASKNGNTIYAFNQMGRVVECTIRVLLGSADDKYLNSRMQEMINGFSDFILLTGAFVKRVGDGSGVISSDVYQCSGGVFKKQVEAKTSAEGDTEQSVAVYMISFGNADKSIQ